MIELLLADITEVKVDAIVNAANESLLGGGGVDGAIHRAAGPELLAACRQLGGCQTGQAKITPAYKLKADYVIHTVGPVWQTGRQGESDLLRSCYQESLKLAQEKGLQTIAFPSISTGVYGYPVHQAAQVAIKAVIDYLNESSYSFEKIYWVLFDQDSYDAYRLALRQWT